MRRLWSNTLDNKQKSPEVVDLMRLRSAPQLHTLFSVLLMLALLLVSQPPQAQESANSDSAAESGTTTQSDNATAPNNNDPAQTSELNGERQNKVVIVKDGDTLTSISRTEFGTPSLWRHIAEFNKINPDDLLMPDQILLIPTLTTAPRQFAVVVYTHGAAMLAENETAPPNDLKRNDRIFPGNIVQTGATGFASISFQNDSVVNLQPESRFKLLHLGCLDSDKTCFIDLSIPVGEMTSEVKSRDDQSTQFRVTTPFASAAVRGTRFDFIASRDQLLLGVTDGIVALQSQGTEVDLELGFGSKTLPNEPPGDPIPLLHLPTFTNIPPRVAITDRIGWWRVTDAVRYEWTISRDAESSSVVESALTPSEFVEINAIPAGDYYLRVRALDNNDLKGFPNTEKFTVADIVELGVEPVELSYTRSGREILIAVQEPDQQIGGYEIQIASTDDFTDVISIDVGPSGQAYVSDMNRRMFLRARALMSPREVSEFGPIIQTD